MAIATSPLFLVAIVSVPMAFLVVTALYRHNLFQTTPPKFVGLDNFYYLFRRPR